MSSIDNIKNKLFNNDEDKNLHDDLDSEYELIYNDIMNGDFRNYDSNVCSFNHVKKLNLFDEDYYISSYNLNISKKYALLHYLKEGFKLGYNPSISFNNEEYYKKYPIIKDMNMNPLVHYFLQDKEIKIADENSKTLDETYQEILIDVNKNDFSKYDSNLKYYSKLINNDLFDENFYVEHYNIPISKKYALLHYLNEGYKRGLNPSSEFSNSEYLKSNLDVKKSNLDPFLHYVLYGQKEGRDFPSSEKKRLMDEIYSLKNEVYINRINQNISLLRTRCANGKKVNVVFILPAMMFVYKELYSLFDNDSNFNVSIVLVPHTLNNGKIISSVAKDKFYQIFAHLKEQNFNVIEGYDFESGQTINIEEISPDIVFYVLPYMRLYPETLKINNLPQNILFAYIPYGEFIENTLEDNLFNFGWNEKIWKIFCSSQSYLINAADKSKIGSSNVFVAGSARMDSLINYKPSEYDYNWIYPKEENKKRIIWAPHHTLSRPSIDENVTYSTFDKNYKFFYEYARDNPNIEWVVRPHPLLKEVLNEVKTNMKIDGIATDDFADDYFFKWDSLPNARVHEEIDYMDLFANADALITDCVSFKAEFLYANKPGLILTRDNYEKDEFKSNIYSAWYVENGADFDKIKEFIEDVVVGENDYLKEKREEIFSNYFNYNVGNASKTIYSYIKSCLFD